jgi:myosin heavy subunit
MAIESGKSDKKVFLRVKGESYKPPNLTLSVDVFCLDGNELLIQEPVVVEYLDQQHLVYTRDSGVAENIELDFKCVSQTVKDRIRAWAKDGGVDVFECDHVSPVLKEHIAQTEAKNIKLGKKHTELLDEHEELKKERKKQRGEIEQLQQKLDELADELKKSMESVEASAKTIKELEPYKSLAGQTHTKLLARIEHINGLNGRIRELEAQISQNSEQLQEQERLKAEMQQRHVAEIKAIEARAEGLKAEQQRRNGEDMSKLQRQHFAQREEIKNGLNAKMSQMQQQHLEETAAIKAQLEGAITELQQQLTESRQTMEAKVAIAAKETHSELLVARARLQAYVDYIEALYRYISSMLTEMEERTAAWTRVYDHWHKYFHASTADSILFPLGLWPSGERSDEQNECSNPRERIYNPQVPSLVEPAPITEPESPTQEQVNPGMDVLPAPEDINKQPGR